MGTSESSHFLSPQLAAAGSPAPKQQQQQHQTRQNLMMEFEGEAILPSWRLLSMHFNTFKSSVSSFYFCPKNLNEVPGHRLYVRDLFFVWDLALVMLGDVWAKDGSEWV